MSADSVIREVTADMWAEIFAPSPTAPPTLDMPSHGRLDGPTDVWLIPASLQSADQTRTPSED
jgi:hypothetical protein